jgi:hypothetical protein
MELVRGSLALRHLVIRLRESGLSWRDVKTAIDAERTKNAINHHARLAAAGVLDAFDQNRPASFEDVVSIETYPRRCMAMSPAELRHLSRVLLAHAGRVRADANASRLRSVKCRLEANVARASASRRLGS